MSNKKYKKLPGIGLRLTQERKRLDYSQAELAEKLDKATVTQISYEADETRPDADYFSGLNELGFDIFYIITGKQLEALKEEDERHLLASYRTAYEKHKPIILNLAQDIAQVDEYDKKNTANKKHKK
jgi:transcriptional regulator with XRE-family HTH domain